MTHYHGHKTHVDGTRTLLTESEAAEIWQAMEARRAQEAEMMPDIAAVLDMTCAIHNRLRGLGWSEGIYCPKDGSDFAVITPGSTGVFVGCYVGTWPRGSISTLDEETPPNGCWWKAIDKLTDDERARMDRDMAFNLAVMETHTRKMAEMVAVLETTQEATDD